MGSARVGAVPPARAFVIRLCRFSRRPKTVDAYARNLEIGVVPS